MPGFDVIFRLAEKAACLERMEIEPVGTDASTVFECLRIEAGLPRYGVDITEANLPQEIDRIEQTISFTKGCYIGQETVARVRSYGHVNRTLRGLVLPEAGEVSVGDKLFHDSAEVGVVTSCTYSPRLERPIALAYVRRGHEAAGTTLILAGNPDRLAAVSDLPLVGGIGAKV
jgi:folate-binding protein YgfZ